MFRNIRYAARALRKTPIFAVTAVFTLALGIGANTAIFSVVNAVMLRSLPFSQPDRLVRIFEKNDKENLKQFSSSALNYLSWKEQAQSFESMANIGYASINLTGKGDPEQFAAVTITPSLFPLLGIRSVLGRAFQDGDDRTDTPSVVMISEGLLKRRFGGDPSVVGSTINLNGVPTTVVGIAPRSLYYLTNVDVSLPMVINQAKENRLNHLTVTVARLKPNVSIAQAQAEMDIISRHLASQYPQMQDWGVQLVDFHHWFVTDQLRTALLALLGAVAFVLLIACANIANLLLSRASARQKEIAVRTALGAGRWQLVSQFLAESLLLSALGGTIGAVGAVFAVRIINAELPPNLLPVPEIPIDSSVLFFALGVTLATGVLFGMAPAWHSLRPDLTRALNSSGRSSTGVPGANLRNWLVGGELALATVLLIGAALLIQSLQHLQEARLGFEPQGLLTFQVTLPPSKYQGGKAWEFYRQMLLSLQSLPGVRSAAVSSGVPLGAGSYTTTPATTVGKTQLPAGSALPIDWRVVSPDYFRTMEIPLVRGRYFDDHDGIDGPNIMIVGQQTATRLWGDDDPIGRQVHIIGSGKDYTVVGVVGDVKQTSLNQETAPTMYYPAAARPFFLMDVVVRTSGKPEAALPAIHRKIHELDPEMPVSNVRTMEQWVSQSAAQPRLNTVLLGVFAGVALLIAIIGVYGVLAYSVAQRTSEIGVRMAIGAQQRDIQRLIVREGMSLALSGIAVGILGALVLSRVIAGMLFEVKAHDPSTFFVIPFLLALVALAACYIPAKRGSRVNPIVALRCE